MASIAQVSRELRRLFEEEAGPLARREGLRERGMRFAQLAYLLVLGWWQQPQAGPSALARFAGSLDLTLCKQEVDAHFTEATARWLLALLRRAVCVLICARQGVKLALLQQFSAVLVEDGSTITLPEALKQVWRGCGGSAATAGKERATEAALKVTVRFDLLGGRLDGPHVQAGRQHELRSVLREHAMAAGSLWIADLGYWTLHWLGSLVAGGVYFLLRYKPGIVLWQAGERLDLLAVLPQVVGERLELLVEVGARRVLRGVRLLAERVPAEVAAQREARYREYARAHGKAVNPLVVELTHWTLLVTNVPAAMLSLEQAFALLRARWQIELLFKLWKEQALVDEWTGSKPARVLCEVYAKLLAMVLQHWVLLLACWDDPHRSLTGVAEIVREQLPLLVHGLAGHYPVQRGLRRLINSVRGGCSIEQHRTRLSTSRRLLCAGGDGLT
jgi:Transposase DDE domain